jgi:hypothetical protein
VRGASTPNLTYDTICCGAEVEIPRRGDPCFNPRHASQHRRSRRASQTSTRPVPRRWRPWAMALTFGFLHGLGFAGTLRSLPLIR